MFDYENSATVTVRPLDVGDVDITIEIAQCGVTEDGRARFSYLVYEGGDIKLSGRDLCGPATGLWPEAADMAVTLGSFLAATFECGQVTEHGRSYVPHERMWLETVADRFGAWVDDMRDGDWTEH